MDQTDAVRGDVLLRDVREDDLPIFFEQQLDPVAVAMAEFSARERDVFKAPWRKILHDHTVATKALSQFLQQAKTCPLYAHVARHNRASLRVPEKCGFTVVGREKATAGDGGEEIEAAGLRFD